MNKLFGVKVYYEVKSSGLQEDTYKRFNVVCETDMEARDWSVEKLLHDLSLIRPNGDIFIKYCEIRIRCNVDHIVDDEVHIDTEACSCGEGEVCHLCP